MSNNFKTKFTMAQKDAWLLERRSQWRDLDVLRVQAVAQGLYSSNTAAPDVRSSLRAKIHRIEKQEALVKS